MKNETIQKDWLKIQKICRDLTWILYGDDYKNIPDFKEALDLLKSGNNKLKKIIEDNK